jgi:uncharacterized UPF0146 family protein
MFDPGISLRASRQVAHASPRTVWGDQRAHADEVKIGHGLWKDAWGDYLRLVADLTRGSDVSRVCEIGGGANPLLPLEFAAEQRLDYLVVDVSSEELRKAPDGYRKIQADITAPAPDLGPPLDLVFSQFLAEHIRDPAALHANIYGLLAAGGRSVHFFPTLYALPFVLNRLLPEAIAETVLLGVQPDRHRGGSHGKFSAYYRWCRGPTRRQLRRLTGTGFQVEQYIGYFGHSYYCGVPALDRLQAQIARQLVRRPVPALTSFAIVVLRKPQSDSER